MLIGRSIPIGVLSIGKTTRSINHCCNSFSGSDLSELMQVIKMISQVNHSWIINDFDDYDNDNDNDDNDDDDDDDDPRRQSRAAPRR